MIDTTTITSSTVGIFESIISSSPLIVIKEEVSDAVVKAVGVGDILSMVIEVLEQVKHARSGNAMVYDPEVLFIIYDTIGQLLAVHCPTTELQHADWQVVQELDPAYISVINTALH